MAHKGTVRLSPSTMVFLFGGTMTVKDLSEQQKQQLVEHYDHRGFAVEFE